MELYQTNHWDSQGKIEKWRMFEQAAMKSRLYQANHAKDCIEIQELRRICFEETERVRQLRADDFYAQKKEELPTMNHLVSQIQE